MRIFHPPSLHVTSLSLMHPLDKSDVKYKNIGLIKILKRWLNLCINSTSRHLPAYRLFIINAPSLRWDGDVVSRPLAAIGWGLCVKKSIWRHLFPRKKEKRKKILPTGVRDGDRDRPQLSPAAPIGWRFVQNPTPTTSLTTHQQILKAYMQPPPSLRRCCTASKPRRSTFNFNPHCCSASEDGSFCSFCSFCSCSRLVLSYFSCRDTVYLRWVLLFVLEETKQTKNFTVLDTRVSFTFNFFFLLLGHY